MNKAIVFHPGTQHSWQTALAFQEGGGLSAYCTSVFYKDSDSYLALLRILPEPVAVGFLRELKRRYHPALNPDLVKRSGIWEYLEIAFNRMGYRKLARKADFIGNRSFSKKVIRQVEQDSSVEVLWGYNNSSLEVFSHFKGKKMLVLDQTIGHWSVFNRYIQEEYDRAPQFFAGGPTLIANKIIERNNYELGLADRVVVGSDFCKDTLIEQGVDVKKIDVLPYGYDEAIFHFDGDLSEPLSRPLQFVFVGSVIPRKGVAALLEAFSQIPCEQAELTVIGPCGVPAKTLHKYHESGIRFISGVPRQEVPSLLAGAHVFVFPSLFEGGGIVLYEAAAMGLAIIQSRMCGDGVGNDNGILLDEVSAGAVIEAVMNLLSDQPRLRQMRENSLIWSGQRRWADYRERVRLLVKELCSEAA